jgi:eukaryotic-like serine/threonine-protein kinase
LDKKKKWLTRLGLVLAIGLALVLVLTGCMQVPATGGSAVTVVGDKLFVSATDGTLFVYNTEGFGRVWKVDLETPSGGGNALCGGFLTGCTLGGAATGVAVYGAPTVDGDRVYVGGYDGRVRLFDWQQRLDQPLAQYPDLESDPLGPITSGIVIGDGLIYFGTGSNPDDKDVNGAIYALDADTLQRHWTYSEFEERVWATPILHDGTLYVASFDGALYAIDAVTGAQKWKFQTEGALVGTPALVDGTLYFGSFDLYFYAVNAATGTLKWRSDEPADKWFWASPVVHDGKVFAPNLDGTVYVFNAASGIEALAPVELGGPLISSPVLSDKWLFVGAETGEVYRIDTATGQRGRYYDESAVEDAALHAPLILNDGVIYVHLQTPDRIYAFNTETGISLSAPLHLSDE